MTIFTTRVLSLTLLLAMPGLAAAQAGADELGITMSVVENEEAISEQDFINEIELPDIAAEQAQSNAQQGKEIANQAQQQGSEFGQERAEEGRNQGNGGNGGNGQPPGGLPIP